MIARTGDLPLAQFGQQGQPVHHRHVDVEQHQLDVGLLRQYRQRLLAVVGEAEGRIASADLPAESLLDQRLEIGLVIDREDLCLAHSSISSGAGQLPQLLLEELEIDRLGEEIGGAAFARHAGAARRRHRPSPS